MEQDIDQFRASTSRWLFGSFSGWMAIVLSLIGIGLAIIAVRWVQNVGLRFTLTNERLIIRRGVIFKQEDEIELYRIKDLRVDFSLLNQLTDIGTITLRSSDATTRGTAFEIRDIHMARKRRETLRTLVDQARQKRGVREFDYDLEQH